MPNHLAIHLQKDLRREEVVRIFVIERGDEFLGSQINIFSAAVSLLDSGTLLSRHLDRLWDKFSGLLSSHISIVVSTVIFNLKTLESFETLLIFGVIRISRGDNCLIEWNAPSICWEQGLELGDIGCNTAGGMTWNLQDGDLQIPESNSIPLANGLACHILSPFEIKG